MTVTNKGSVAIEGPIQVVLTGLPDGVTMINRDGLHDGRPFISASSVPLAPGGSVSVPIQFSNPSGTFINFTAVTYTGGLQ